MTQFENDPGMPHIDRLEIEVKRWMVNHVLHSDKAMSLVPLILIPQVLFSGAFGLSASWTVQRLMGYVMPLNWSLDLFKRGAAEGAKEDAGMMQMPPGVEAPSHWLPYVAVEDVDASAAKAVMKLFEGLEDQEDVKDVYSSADIQVELTSVGDALGDDWCDMTRGFRKTAV